MGNSCCYVLQAAVIVGERLCFGVGAIIYQVLVGGSVQTLNLKVGILTGDRDCDCVVQNSIALSDNNRLKISGRIINQK